MSQLQGAGGTPGGITHFFVGSGLAGLGLYLLFSRVVVSSGGMWHGYFGAHYGAGPSLGVTVGPFVAGVALLFFDGRSKLGWGLSVASLLLLAAEIVTSLRVHFEPTRLPVLLAMIAMVGAGFGLIGRSLRSS